MRITSWNVNGLRAVLGKGFADSIPSLQTDILCLQEIKATPDQLDPGMPAALGFAHAFYHSAEKKGYSGTAVFSRVAPLQISCGIGNAMPDTEGRVQHLEFPGFHLINVYTPNSQNELRRLTYRMEWDEAFRHHLAALQKSKPVVFTGDLNVAHKEIDLARPAQNRRSAGFTDEEREGFSRLLESGFVDTFREFESGPDHYSWWSYRGGARARNVGWRIDYCGASTTLRPRLLGAGIRPDIHGSDHCPVWMDFDAPTE